MRQMKLFRGHPMIRMVAIVNPQVDRPVLRSDSQLQRDNSAFELRLLCGLLQDPEVEGLWFECKDLAIRLGSSRQNRSRIADIRSDIQDVSPAHELGKCNHQAPQIVFKIAFVGEIGVLE